MTKGKGGPEPPRSEPEVCAFRRALRRERGTGDLRRTALEEELLLPLPLLRAMAEARSRAKERILENGAAEKEEEEGEGRGAKSPPEP